MSAFVVGVDVDVFVGQIVGPYGGLGVRSGVEVDVNVDFARGHVDFATGPSGTTVLADAHAVDVDGHLLGIIRCNFRGNGA